ncbi:MAG: heme A synthase [Nitrospirae bacterium]|nr:heme A synthase [Nitrospirota bacterium]
MKKIIEAINPTYPIGITILFLYLLMIMGAFVTSTGSGLACPDWPLCYGSVRPPFRMHIWFEWGHRLLGALTGSLLIMSTAYVWIRYKGAARILTALILGLLFLGVLIGGVTVLTEAPYLDNIFRVALVSSHLIIATMVLTSLIFTLRKISGNNNVAEKGYAFFLFCLVYLQVILGILVRYSKASLACPDFPLCQGQIIPFLGNGAVALHFIHRVTAGAVLLFTIFMLYKAIKMGSGIRVAAITMSLVIMQVVLGISLILTGLFLPVIILHGATGFLLLGWLAYQSAPFLFSKRDILWNMQVAGSR